MDRKDLDVTLYLVTDSSYHTEESLLRTVEDRNILTHRELLIQKRL